MNFAGFLTVTLIFISGIGRYRVVLVYAVYSLLKAVLPLIKVEHKILFFLPATVIALFFDITKGPILPIFTKNYLIIALSVMVVADTVVRNSIGKLIANLTEDQLFVVCPSCNYDNKYLVEKCSYCSYKKGDKLKLQTAKQPLLVRSAKISNRISSMLRLPADEEILFHMKVASHAIFRNGIKQARVNFLITMKSMILIDYYRFAIGSLNSWIEKDVVPLSNITAVEAKMKKFTLLPEPLIAINTSTSDKFEIIFYSRKKCRERFNEIISIVKKVNPQVETKINLPEPDNSWKEVWK